MKWLWPVDWRATFVPHAPLLETFVRGTIVYLVLFTLLRVVLKRQRGGFGMSDLLVLVLIADAAQNAMAGDYHSIPDGVLLVAVIIGWAFTLDWLGYRFPRIQRFVHPPPLPLYRHGRLHRENMRRENVTDDELASQLRAQGVRDLEEVEEILLEGDGDISVLRKDTQDPAQRPGRRVL